MCIEKSLYMTNIYDYYDWRNKLREYIDLNQRNQYSNNYVYHMLSFNMDIIIIYYTLYSDIIIS